MVETCGENNRYKGMQEEEGGINMDKQTSQSKFRHLPSFERREREKVLNQQVLASDPDKIEVVFGVFIEFLF